MERVLILGATGRFGRAAADAFDTAGWDVARAARSWPRPDAGHLAFDPCDAAALRTAAEGCDVIVNALNPPYPDWPQVVPQFTTAVVGAARHTGATVLIPGNVYNYGAAMPALLTEDTPWRAQTRKGRIRIEMEQAYRDAGVRTIVLRGGDFLEAAASGNWFDVQIATKAWAGKVVYPGPLDAVHAWAWLPDMARAAEALAAKRDASELFEEFGFPGYALTGQDLVDLIARAVQRDVKVRGLPWPVIRTLGLVAPMMREISEMRYLWHRPHAIDGTKLAQAVPDLTETPAAEAIAQAVAALRSK